MQNNRCVWAPKTVRWDDGRTLKWEENIPQDKLNAMTFGEIFTLLNPDGTPHSKVFENQWGDIINAPLTTGGRDVWS